MNAQQQHTDKVLWQQYADEQKQKSKTVTVRKIQTAVLR